MGGQIVVPAPRMVLEEPARDAEFVGELMELVAGVGEQMAELGEAQPSVRVVAQRVHITGHVPNVRPRHPSCPCVVATYGDDTRTTRRMSAFCGHQQTVAGREQ